MKSGRRLADPKRHILVIEIVSQVTLTSVAICLTGRLKRQKQQQQVPQFAVGHKWQLKAAMVIIGAGPLAWLGSDWPTTTTALDIVINFDLWSLSCGTCFLFIKIKKFNECF